jgi:hypothetical protein
MVTLSVVSQLSTYVDEGSYSRKGLLMKLNYWGVLGMINIAVIVGMTISDVGTIPECTNEPYTWHMPIYVGSIFLISFIFGCLTRIEIDKESDK